MREDKMRNYFITLIAVGILAGVVATVTVGINYVAFTSISEAINEA